MRRQAKFEERVVVIDDRAEVCESSVVIEAALLPREQAAQWRGPIAVGGSTIGLKVVDTDFRRRMQIVARFGVERRCLARLGSRHGEDLASAGSRRRVVRARGRQWSGDGKLIEMQGGELRCDKVGLLSHVEFVVLDRYRKLRGVLQRSEERRVG